MFNVLDLTDGPDGPADSALSVDCALCTGFLPELALEPAAECPGMFLVPRGLPGAMVVVVGSVQGRGVKK